MKEKYTYTFTRDEVLSLERACRGTGQMSLLIKWRALELKLAAGRKQKEVAKNDQVL